MKKLNKLAKEINELLLDDVTIKRYLELKKEIENDESLSNLYNRLDKLRKEICKDKSEDSDEYYSLLEIYKSDVRVKEYELLKKDVIEFFEEISDILKIK